MGKQAKLRWKFYLCLYSPLTIGSSIALLFEGSTVYEFYHILMAFKKSSSLLYLASLGGALFNIFSLVPLFLFAFGKRFLRAWVWKIFFVLKIIFDTTGHRFEFLFLQSNFHQDFYAGLSGVILLTIYLLPSYIALFMYAFMQKRLFNYSSPSP